MKFRKMQLFIMSSLFYADVASKNDNIDNVYVDLLRQDDVNSHGIKD